MNKINLVCTSAALASIPGWIGLLHGEVTPEQKEILGHLSIIQLDDGQGGTAKTIRFSDANEASGDRSSVSGGGGNLAGRRGHGRSMASCVTAPGVTLTVRGSA